MKSEMPMRTSLIHYLRMFKHICKPLFNGGVHGQDKDSPG
jgi:hypothetical protein